jgi:hypothetical protein
MSANAQNEFNIANNEENREQLAIKQVDGWDFEDLWDFVVTGLEEEYEKNNDLFQQNWDSIIGDSELNDF